MSATHYGTYPKIQLLTIEELFAGKKPNIPLVGQTAFKKAQVEQRSEQGRLLTAANMIGLQNTPVFHRASPR